MPGIEAFDLAHLSVLGHEENRLDLLRHVVGRRLARRELLRAALDLRQRLHAALVARLLPGSDPLRNELVECLGDPAHAREVSGDVMRPREFLEGRAPQLVDAEAEVLSEVPRPGVLHLKTI